MSDEEKSDPEQPPRLDEDASPEDDMSDEEKSDPEQPPRLDEAREVVRAEDLFKGGNEVWIELDGVRYRLRITRRGKLILQK